MNNDNRNISPQVVEELFEGLEHLLRNRRKHPERAQIVREQREAAIPTKPEEKVQPRLKPRLEHSPR